MPTFASKLNHQLAAYKTSRLGVKEAGTFIYRGREVRHGHILPRELRWLNILEAYRTEVRQYVESRKAIKHHKYFHHLNSSQALALNLFFPFMQGGHSPVLLRAMGIHGAASTWTPEYIADPIEGTNIDVSWQSTSGEWTFCEIKLTEQEFGKAKDDKRHRAKLDEIYRPVLSPYCPADLLEPSAFFANYQVFRNLWLVAREPAASLVFLLPRQNVPLWAPLNAVLQQVAPALRKRARAVALEDVLGTLASGRSVPPHLAWYAQQLTEKYVFRDAAA